MYSLDISKTITCTMFGRMRQTNGWEVKTQRKVPANIFVFMIEGQASFYIEQQHFAVSAGEILIIPANTAYFANTNSSCEYFFFHFSGIIRQDDDIPIANKNINGFSFILSECERDRIFFDLKTHHKPVYDKIYASIISCVEYHSSSSKTKRLLLDNEFFKILLILAGAVESTAYQISPALEKMIIYIQKNLTSPIQLQDLSAHCSVSVPYVSRLFKKHLNMTAKEYINSEKMLYACELIQNTGMSIGEISSYLGYCDVFYFSKLFKKYFGKSPTKIFKS